MALVSIKNHYHGINTHLNSLLQRRDWDEFHSHHISDITSLLNQKLRGTGYYAKLEKGLQIRYEATTRHPESDVLILKRDTPEPSVSTATLPKSYPLTLETTITPADLLPDTYEDAEYFTAITVRHVALTQPGDYPIAWIELLSPTNKKRGSHYRAYIEKRQELFDLHACVYVEIDYLHRSSPTFKVPDYHAGERKARPYRVVVMDTRLTTPDTAPGDLIQWQVDQPIPPVPIPLRGEDYVMLDLNGAYQSTFERVGYGLLPHLEPDYASLPLDWLSYHPPDLAQIKRRMATVQQMAQLAAAQGLALDDYLEQEKIAVPLPIDETTPAP